MYLIEHSYPCAVLLSRKLSFAIDKDKEEMVRWIHALAQHIKAVIKMISEQTAVKSSGKQLVALNREHYILKPVPLDIDQARVRGWVTDLLVLFQTLWNRPECRDIVVFPQGVIGFPTDKDQPFAAELCNELRYVYDKKVSAPPSLEDYKAGWPILVYENLELSGWIRADLLLKEHKVSANVASHTYKTASNDISTLRKLFIQSLKNAVQRLKEAGVVHIDLRIYNIFYKVTKDRSDEPEVLIKIIDWDDCLLEGRTIRKTIRDARNDDARFPPNKGEPVKGNEFYRFFLDIILKELS